MTGNLVISVVVVLGLLVLLAGFTNPWRKIYRQRWWEDQMASEKPFQLGDDPIQTNHIQSFFDDEV